MTNKQILIIGLDSATWDVLDPVIERGHMPNLKRLREGGCYGVLRSTDPPITPPAWTTLMTGVNPGKHGVVAFEYYDCASNRLHFTTSKSIACETMWTYLSRLGYKVASLNLPQTYPPFPVNGVMVSGYGCPGINFDYTYPRAFKEQIHRRIPDYDMLARWQGENVADDRVFARNIAHCKRTFEHSYELAQLVQDQYKWDVMLVQIHQLDTLQHKMWRYLTPAAWQRWPERAEQIFALFRHLDEVIGKLAALAGGNDDLIIIASDHGHGPVLAKVKPNNLLRDWGFLKRLRSGRRMLHRLKRHLYKLAGARTHFSKGPTDPIEKFALDWSRTRAVMLFAAQHAFVFFNVKERQKGGIVEPGAQYDHLIEELRRRFLDVRDPETGQNIFTAVKTPQELYGISDGDQAAFGDLILIAADGYLPIRSLRGTEFIQPARDGDLGGCHRYEGMFVLHGSGVKAACRLNAHIADIAPTVYAALGVAPPYELDGKVLNGAFTTPLEVNSPQPVSPPAVPERQGELSPAEQELISKRLADLGYLE